VSLRVAFVIRKRTEKLSVQLWSVNQRTTEEVTYSYIRTKSDTVEEKTLVV
jgi:hypothetical protein